MKIFYTLVATLLLVFFGTLSAAIVSEADFSYVAIKPITNNAGIPCLEFQSTLTAPRYTNSRIKITVKVSEQGSPAGKWHYMKNAFKDDSGNSYFYLEYDRHGGDVRSVITRPIADLNFAPGKKYDVYFTAYAGDRYLGERKLVYTAPQQSAPPTSAPTQKRQVAAARTSQSSSSGNGKTYYLAWGTSASNAAWVGEGANAKQISIRISGNNATFKEGGRSVTVPFYIEKNGIRRFMGKDNVGGYWVDVHNDGKYASVYKFTSDFSIMSSHEFYASSTEERDRMITQNRSYTRQGNPANVPTVNRQITSGSGDAQLRYPEYQKYNDKRGNFDNRKYQQQTQAKCSLCGGTGLNPYPTYSAGSRSEMHNNAGEKCHICGRWDKHYHDRCPSCRR